MLDEGCAQTALIHHTHPVLELSLHMQLYLSFRFSFLLKDVAVYCILQISKLSTSKNARCNFLGHTQTVHTNSLDGCLLKKKHERKTEALKNTATDAQQKWFVASSAGYSVYNSHQKDRGQN